MWDAFESGDVEGVLAVPRAERKQLFVTRFAMEFTRDIENADFPEPDSGTSIYAPYRLPSVRSTPMGPAGWSSTEDEDDEESMEPTEKTGFTVLIEGYSPYRAIPDLLDPPSVRNDQSRWGFVTRMEKLTKLFPKASFEMFGKSDTKHFEIKTGLVDLGDPDMPVGIGVPKEIERVPQKTPATTEYAVTGYAGYASQKTDVVYKETVLVDPMTNEEISRTYDIITRQDINNDPELDTEDLGKKKYDKLDGEELFIDRDHWFRVKAKFIWKNAPEEEVSESAEDEMYDEYEF